MDTTLDYTASMRKDIIGYVNMLAEEENYLEKYKKWSEPEINNSD